MHQTKTIKMITSLFLLVFLLSFTNFTVAQKRKRTNKLVKNQTISKIPTISIDKIDNDLVNKTISIPSSEVQGVPSNWMFGEGEVREIEIIKNTFQEDDGYIVIKIYTKEEPKENGALMAVKGNMRLHYERIAGDWILADVDNISLTYKTYGDYPSLTQPQNVTSQENIPTVPNQNTRQAQKVLLINTAFTVGAGEHYRVPFSVNNTGVVTGRFNAQGGSGNDIKVYILDADSYTNFTNRHTVSTFYNSGQVTVGNINTVLRRGNYFLIFDNGYSTFSNKAITATVELTLQ